MRSRAGTTDYPMWLVGHKVSRKRGLGSGITKAFICTDTLHNFHVLPAPHATVIVRASSLSHGVWVALIAAHEVYILDYVHASE